MENAISTTAEDRKVLLMESLARIRPQVSARNSSISLSDRLAKFANYEPAKTIDKGKDIYMPLSLNDLIKKESTLSEELKEAGVFFKDNNEVARLKENANQQSNDFDRRFDKNGRKIDNSTERDFGEHDKDYKEKKKEEKELTPEKQAERMKDMFASIKLPSGMEIRQEGPSWMMYSKDGKEATNITDVVGAIDKYNRSVEEVNSDNLKSNVENAAETQKGKEETNKSDAIYKNVEASLPSISDSNGNPVFKPEDIKKMTEIAIDFSNESIHMGNLSDPRYIEEQMKKRNKDTNNRADDKEHAKLGKLSPAQMYHSANKANTN